MEREPKRIGNKLKRILSKNGTCFGRAVEIGDVVGGEKDSGREDLAAAAKSLHCKPQLGYLQY
jgi:hypothetical protein